MASAWGSAWGKSWGNSWGSIGVAVVGGRVPGGKRRKVFVEWRGRIYLFDNAAQAATWLQHQKWLERIGADGAESDQNGAQQANDKPAIRKVGKQGNPIPEPEVLDPVSLGARVERYQTGLTVSDIQRMLESQQWGALLDLQARVNAAEDEEIVLLLLAS